MDELNREEIDRLRALWDAGIASGRAPIVDRVKFLEEAQRRLKIALKAKARAGLSVEEG